MGYGCYDPVPLARFIRPMRFFDWLHGLITTLRKVLYIKHINKLPNILYVKGFHLTKDDKSTLPSGFKSKKEYNKYMRDYRRRKKQDHRQALQLLEYFESERKSLEQELRAIEYEGAVTLQNNLVEGLIEILNKPEFEKGVSKAVVEKALQNINLTTEKYRSKIHKRTDDLLADFDRKINAVMDEVRALLHIQPESEEKSQEVTVEVSA